MSQKPTIGRIVHFFDGKKDKPYAALVTDDMPPGGADYISVSIFNHGGGRFAQLLYSEEGKPMENSGYFWRWPERV